ncbi:cilia- and flagella-associated protein 299 isoform X3 [Syngnathus scovelli]|uniref:cilia- and flagella-associated protein 299 isoform X3 n=1 Tax=Syngnathus scovelli TaxID=161590 RepID=UPI00211096AB|nr:cilia- and flagella-associated protein 299 isoform X3 [Syngnathus scovelli]
MESINTNIQDAVTRFKDYKEYLDSKMTSMDLVFLTSKEVARKLVEHGHKGTVLSRREFEQQKAASASATRYHRNQTTTLASSGCDIRDNFLRELAEREEANRTGKMTSLLFIRDVNAAGQEVSGYLDYAHKLQTRDFAPYFSGRKKLMPGPRDLCSLTVTTIGPIRRQLPRAAPTTTSFTSSPTRFCSGGRRTAASSTWTRESIPARTRKGAQCSRTFTSMLPSWTNTSQVSEMSMHVRTHLT